MPAIETVYQRYNRSQNACRLNVSRPTTFAITNENVQNVVPAESFQRAPLRKGDHVMALPYWSDKTSVQLVNLKAISGKVEMFERHTLDNSIPPLCPPTGMPAVARVLEVNVPKGAFFAPLPLNWNQIPAVQAATWQSLEKLADTRALARINQSMVNLPMLFKERRETIRMAAGKVSRLADAAKRLQERGIAQLAREKTRAGRRKVARDIANEHLEVIFGWMPLLGEIEGAMEYAEMPILDFIRANATQTLMLSSIEIASNRNISFLPPYSSIGRVRGKGDLRHVISCRTALRYELEHRLYGDARQLGFEPISTFYDMIPLSFVSGWFSNFDAYVRTLAPQVGLTFVTGSRNRRTRLIAEYSHTFTPDISTPSGVRVKIPSFSDTAVGTVVARRERNDRVPLMAPPEASLHFGLDVGIFEAAAAASLLIQRYLKPLKKAIKQRPFKYRGPRPLYLPPIRYRKVS